MNSCTVKKASLFRKVNLNLSYSLIISFIEKLKLYYYNFSLEFSNFELDDWLAYGPNKQINSNSHR